jgi:hypothetical protein
VSQSRNLPLDAADIGHDRAGAEARADLLHDLHDPVDRRGDYDEVGVLHGRFRSLGDGRAPRLIRKGQPDLGPTRPNDDPGGHAARERSLGNRSAEQTRRENGE